MAEPSPPPYNVLVCTDLYDRYLAEFQQRGGTEVAWWRSDLPQRTEEFLRLLPLADCMITRNDLTDEEYEMAGRLKLIQLPTAGYDHIDLQRAKRHGIPVAANGGANAWSVAEHTIMMMLAIYRQLLHHHRTVVSGQWENRKYSNLELCGKRLGIVGLGNIGRKVAGLAHAFGMEVVYNDLRPAPAELVQSLGLRSLGLEELLSTSDLVTLHVPLTSLTRGMINADTLALMKPQAVLINTARGPIVKQDALCEALVKERLKGAGLDVFEHEPLPAGSPLGTLPGVVLSPHAGPSLESRGRIVENVAENVLRVLRGQAPQHLAIDYEHFDPANQAEAGGSQ